MSLIALAPHVILVLQGLDILVMEAVAQKAVLWHLAGLGLINPFVYLRELIIRKKGLKYHNYR